MNMTYLAALLLGFATASSADETPKTEAAASAETARLIAAELETGGSLYCISSDTQSFKSMPSRLMSQMPWRNDFYRDGYGFNPQPLFSAVNSFFYESGLSDIRGTGISTVRRADGLQRTRMVALLADSQQGLFRLHPAGQPAWDLNRRLPADTVLAMSTSLDLGELLKLFLKNNPELQNELDQVLDRLLEDEFPVNPHKLVRRPLSAALAITFDPVKKLEFKDIGNFKRPEVTLLGRLEGEKPENVRKLLELVAAQGKFQLSQVGGASVWTQIGEPDLSFTFAMQGDLIIASSSPARLEAALKQQGGFTDSAEFKKLSQQLPERADSLLFISERLTVEYKSAISAGLKQANPELATTLDKHLKDLHVSLLALGTHHDAITATHMTSNHGPIALSAIAGVAVAGSVMAQQMMELMMIRSQADVTRSKNNLKQHGLCIASFFSDGTTTNFADALDHCGYDVNRLNSPANKDKVYTIEDFKAGRADYVMVNYHLTYAAVNDSATVVMFERPGLWPAGYVNGVLALYGDGHVAVLEGDFKSVEDVLKVVRKKAGQPH